VSYSVTRQRHEFGVRLALGATPPQLLGLVMRGMTGPVLTGLVAGIVAALVLSRNLNALLFGVAASDAATYVLAATLLAMIAVAAMLGPARRATQTDPARVLSTE
jgi:putative ABC transport system permease protein